MERKIKKIILKKRLIQVFKTIVLVLIISLIVGSIATTIEYIEELEIQNENLIQQVNKRDSLIADSRYRDSLYNSQTRTYEKTIHKYIQGCEFIFDGKKISVGEFVRKFNDALNENEIVLEELEIQKQINNRNAFQIQNLKDSIRALNNTFWMILNEYDLTTKVDKKTNRYNFNSLMSSKTDTALLIYPYFKDRVTKNPNADSWTIRVSPTKTVTVIFDRSWKSIEFKPNQPLRESNKEKK